MSGISNINNPCNPIYPNNPEFPKKSKSQRRRERKAERKRVKTFFNSIPNQLSNYKNPNIYEQRLQNHLNNICTGLPQIVNYNTQFRNVNNQPQTNKKNKTRIQKKGETGSKTSGSANQQPISRIPNNSQSKNAALLHIPTKTVNKSLSNNPLNKDVTSRSSDTPEKLTDQILMQLSNLDTKNLKSVINNSNAKFESALQAQARKKFRSELRKKLRSFNLNREQSVVNHNDFNNMLNSGRISNDVLKRIEEVFKIDIFQGTDHNDEVTEIIDESDGDDDVGSTSNDVLSDTYMLLVKYGLIPELSNPEVMENIDEVDKTNKDFSKTNIINVDHLPSVPLVYEGSTNITNDDVILIEPRREIITIGSPERESLCGDILYDEDLELQPDNELGNNSNNQDESIPRTETVEEPKFINKTTLIDNPETCVSSSILTIIKEYNANLQKCYEEKNQIDLKIASLQSQKTELENTIVQIQSTQTQLLELFLTKSRYALTESQNSIESTSSGMLQRKRKLSTNSSISSQEYDKQPRLEISEPNSNSVDTITNTNTNSCQRLITNTDNQVQKWNSQYHTRIHSSEIKDIIKTNDYLLVSAGSEIFRYSLNNFELEKVYKRHKLFVTGVYVLNNEYVFSGSLDMNLHKFSLEGFQNPLSTQCFKESLTALEYGWNNLFIGSARGRIIAFNIDTNKICLDFHSDVKNSISTLKSVEVSNKKYLTVLTSKSLCLYICDAQTGSLIKTIDTFNYINDISIDNDFIYCGLNSNELLTFSIFSGRSHDPKELDTKSTIKCVKTYKNLVLVGCCDGYIHIYHKSTNLFLDLVRITDKGLVCFEVYRRTIVFCAADKSLTINDMPQQITIFLE